MITIYRMYVRRNLLDSYPTAWAYLGEFCAISINLVVYWYTAKAFSPVLMSGLGNYFEFVIWGEILMAIPLVLLTSTERVVRAAILDGSFDAMILSPHPISIVFMINSLGSIPKELGRIGITFLMAAIAFEFHFPKEGMAQVIALQIISIPIFLGLGLGVAGIFLIFGRGTGLVHHLSILLAVFAGVYFPLSVLPQWIQEALKVISPYTLLLQNSRLAFAGQDGDSFLPLLIWGVGAMVLGIFVFNLSFLQIRRRGSVPILT